LSESSSDTEDDAPVIENEALEMPPVGSTYEVGGPSSVTPFPPFHMHGSEITRFDVLSDRDEWRRAFLNLQALVFEILGWGSRDARPGVGNDGPFSFREPKPPKPPGSPSGSH
nr:hypothetical protein [Tanacetum cinerariifolium]